MTGVVPLKAIVITDPIRENAKSNFDFTLNVKVLQLK